MPEPTPDEIKLADEQATEALALSRQLMPLLYGKGPSVQGATLANLVSLWLAGHRPDIRAAALANFVETASKLVPASEKEIFGPLGWNAQ